MLNDDEREFPSVTGSTVASGKYAVATIAVLAVGLVAFGLWFHYQQQRAALEFWGADAAQMIVQAPHVEAWLLESGPGVLEADGRKWRVVATRDVSRAPGFSHVRLSLIKDGSFDWSAAGPAEPIEWRYALLFRGPHSESTSSNQMRDSALVLFSPDCDLALSVKASQTIALPTIAAAFDQFFDEQFADSASDGAPRESAP